MRVLIVEDDAAARRGLTELVRAWGYEADNAADGQEGKICLDRRPGEDQLEPVSPVVG